MLPALPGASDSATAAKSVTADAPSKSVQPEAPSQAARTSVTIAPEPDEVVVVSTSTVTTVGQPPRLQQRKGINLGFCRNQEKERCLGDDEAFGFDLDEELAKVEGDGAVTN